jgi:DNA-binding NarL/FixJ family response regulator
MVSGSVFTEPATIHQIATDLVVSDAAIKQHLLNLYDKFAIHGEGERRRVRLANAAIMRGAVAVADLREGGSASPNPEP